MCLNCLLIDIPKYACPVRGLFTFNTGFVVICFFFIQLADGIENVDHKYSETGSMQIAGASVFARA